MIPEVLSRLRFFFQPKPAADLDAELRAHVDHATDANIAAGMSPEEARRRALVEFGSVQAAREQSHKQRPGSSLDTLRQDLRYTLRTLRRDSGFTTIAVLILALGIGANIVVFSLVNTILLRPLPLYQPDRLVSFSRMSNNSGLSGATYSVDAYEDLRAMNHSYADITGYFAFSGPDNIKLTGKGIPQPATAVPVLSNFFHVLGVTPMLGRDFNLDDARNGNLPVALLSYAYWKSQFHADPNIVGKVVSMNDTPVPIVGVMPASFDFGAIFTPGAKVDMFFPQVLNDIRDEGNTLDIFGRLKPRATLPQASAEAVTLFPQLYWNRKQAETKGAYGEGKVTIIKEYVAGQLRRSLYVLWAAVGLILLIVCVNLSNLLIARAATRSKEFALRIALGAGRGRLVRQLLTESTVLSVTGAAFGLGIAYAATGWFAHQGSLALPLLSSLHVDGYVLLWTLLVAIIASVLFGLAPGLKISSGNIQESLKDSGQTASDGRKHEGLRTMLVVSEVALACVLVVGAGLLLRSFLNVLDVDLGFRPAQATSLSLDVPRFITPDKKFDSERQNAFFRNVVSEVSTVPGVDKVGITDSLPFSLNRTWGPPGLRGVQYGDKSVPDPRPSPFIYVISPGYFAAMGTPVHGRDIAWSDNDQSGLVMVINQKAAQFLFPNQDAVGRLVDFSGQKDVRIVGVVPDVHETDLEADPGWQVYLSIVQKAWGPSATHLVLRSDLAPTAYASAVMEKIRTINPSQPRVDFLPIQSYVNHATSPRRFFAVLVGVFAALGVVLASLGIYGVISYSVTRQTQEIGIRMALGATRERVQRAVIGKTLRLAVIGIVVGTGASFLVAKAISSMLFATQPTDPVTFAAMVLLLLTVAFFAGYLPGRRASRIDPMVALRSN